MTTASAIRIDDLYTTRAVSAHSYHEQLSADDVEQFHAQGWLAVEGVYSPSEVEAYKAALRDIIHGVSPACEGLYIQEEPYYAEAGETVSSEEERELRIRKLIWFVRADARLMQASRHPRLCTLLSQLIGSGSTMIQDMALLKPPRHGSEKPWHQDTAYFDWLPLGGIVGCWLAPCRTIMPVTARWPMSVCRRNAPSRSPSLPVAVSFSAVSSTMARHPTAATTAARHCSSISRLRDARR